MQARENKSDGERTWDSEAGRAKQKTRVSRLPQLSNQSSQGTLWASPLSCISSAPLGCVIQPFCTDSAQKPFYSGTSAELDVSWCQAWGTWDWSCGGRRRSASGTLWPWEWCQPLLEAKASSQGLRIRQAEQTWECMWLAPSQTSYLTPLCASVLSSVKASSNSHHITRLYKN